MGYIDMHCDTLLMFAKPSETNNLYQNDKQVDFSKLKAGHAFAQFFAIFMLNEEDYKMNDLEPITDKDYIERLYKSFVAEIERHKNIVGFARSYGDYQKNKETGIISAYLTIEDGRYVNGNLENLQKLYDIGVRLISLTWNFENCFGYPNSKEEEIMSKGLKTFGVEAIKRMNELGIIVDVSHLSDGGFWDVVKYSNKPFVASHSNCRIISPHTRNLRDDMIRALGETGSVAGVNFGGIFLNESIENQSSTIDAIITHIKHFKKIGGIECVGFGSDFDGILGEQEVSDSSKMPLVINRLEQAGFLPSEIDKIAFGNVERIIADNL